MIIGKFNIESEEVTINGVTEISQIIIYYDLYGNEITRATYSGDIDEISPNHVNLNNCPPKVMRWQFKTQLALMPSPDDNFSSLEEYIDYLITQMTGENKIIIEKAWKNANTISRYSQTIIYFANILGLTETEIDEIFISANNIKI